MDRQDIYNRVRDHLLAQGERSDNADSGDAYRCCYRGSNGTKCAIGALIADEHYTEDLDTRNMSADHPAVIDAVSKSIGVKIDSESTFAFLCALQRVHDDVWPADWRDALADFAYDYGLQP